MAATYYLDRLGLDTAADERAIKRAYARELKQIDQETDADGFQVLRHAYEMALQWVQQQSADTHVAPAAVAPELPAVARAVETNAPFTAAPVESVENPQQLAQAVFEVFLVLCDEMAVHGDGRDMQLWRQHLQRCIGDERLLNLTASSYFEYLIARLLADGWRKGHESLFIVAGQLFSWEKDRRRLMEFGRVGALLNQAIDECQMFTQQQSDDCSGQTDAVARVQKDAAPNTSELLTHVPHLRNMVERFPAWLGVITSTERVRDWLELEEAIPRWRRLRFDWPWGTGNNSRGKWWKVGLCLLAVRIVFWFFNSTPAPTAQLFPQDGQGAEQRAKPSVIDEAEIRYRKAAGDLYMPPGTRQLSELPQPVPAATPVAAPPKPVQPQRRALTNAEMAAIFEPIRFAWPEGSHGTLAVHVSVELDERGAITKLSRTVSSGLTALDKQVDDAIRAAAPFNAQISRSFNVKTSWKRLPPKEKAEPEKAPVPDPATS